MAYVYAQSGPPFNFLGTVAESQWNAFKAWVEGKTTSLSGVEMHHRIRAQQLRKTAGLLEHHNATEAEDTLVPTFVKDAWQPATTGHFAFASREDHTPAMAVSRIKKSFQPRLQQLDDAMFHMNHLRSQIERQEDLAQYASEAPAELTLLLQKIDALFGHPEYQAALVKDVSDLYKGEPRFRVNPLDPPTAWERMQQDHGTP